MRLRKRALGGGGKVVMQAHRNRIIGALLLAMILASCTSESDIQALKQEQQQLTQENIHLRQQLDSHVAKLTATNDHHGNQVSSNLGCYWIIPLCPESFVRVSFSNQKNSSCRSLGTAPFGRRLAALSGGFGAGRASAGRGLALMGGFPLGFALPFTLGGGLAAPLL